MTPSQIRTARKRLGLSGAAYAAALGFTGRHRAITVHRWETGERKPSAQTIVLIKMLLDGT
jgi:DNA-binding transcriptional regulator YiaG